MTFPDQTEYQNFYHTYISKVSLEENLEELLSTQLTEVTQLFGPLTEKSWGYRYAEGKWSLKELVGHLVDAEHIMMYRALSIARGEDQALPGFDHNAYVEAAGFDQMKGADLLNAFSTCRQHTLALLPLIPHDEETRMGNSNGAPVSVRALCWIVPSHVMHHLGVVRERYSSALDQK
ncbi:MAG: DinB family protein [Bacteroidota bacterium]